MSSKVKSALDAVRRILVARSFSDMQIEKLIPRLHHDYIEHPEALSEIIDCWNGLLGKAMPPEYMNVEETESFIPKVASPPKSSAVAKRRVNMATILAEVEPDLLLFSPEKLNQRHRNLQGLGIFNNSSEHWITLFNAPRGFYLQDWFELTKKIMYVDNKVIDLLYDKRERKDMQVHPLITSAAVTEWNFDHIRTRYLFAQRTGYTALSHMRTVQTSLTRPSLKDLILSSDDAYLAKFAPFCSVEEFSCFSNLIKNHEIDEEDADLISKLAELESLRHPSTSSHMGRRNKLEDTEIVG